MPPAQRRAPTIPAFHGPAVPDRRLSSIYTKRTPTAPTTARSIGILSSYAPTACGVANFSRSLGDSLIADRAETTIKVVRLSQGEATSSAPEVVLEVPAEGPADNQAAARALNKCDVVVIQHEFGLYRGEDGDHVLEILQWLRVPVVVVLHTIPANPTPRQREILERLTASADSVVAMSETGRDRLVSGYQVAARKVMLIPHGAKPLKHEPMRVRTAKGRRPTILTWGLLGPGKGIEWAVDALLHLRGFDPLPRYVVAGQTHPKVLAAEGEEYRRSLHRRAALMGVSHMIDFEPGYMSSERLLTLLQRADVVLLPYDSSEQVTSGVLVEAIAAHVPVVSTAFPHAQELLAGETGGFVVGHRDSKAIAAALTRILTEPGLAEEVVAQQSRRATAIDWATVASQYRQLFDALLRQPANPAL